MYLPVGTFRNKLFHATGPCINCLKSSKKIQKWPKKSPKIVDAIELAPSAEEEREYKQSGYLPPHVRDQTIKKGIAVDLPTLYGRKPICKENLKVCMAGSKTLYQSVHWLSDIMTTSGH